MRMSGTKRVDSFSATDLSVELTGREIAVTLTAYRIALELKARVNSDT